MLTNYFYNVRDKNINRMQVLDSDIISGFLNKRGVKYLYHFTPICNLGNIICNGLLSIKELKSRGIKCVNLDKNRFDYREAGISLSVSHINSKLLQYYKHNYNLPFCVLEIDVSVLYNNLIVKEFLYSNAAKTEFRYNCYTQAVDLYNMFSFDSGKYTEDEQAEIIFYGIIPFKFINHVYFECDSDIPDNFLNSPIFSSDINKFINRNSRVTHIW